MSVALLSGGLDSAILLAVLAKAGVAPLCMTFRYGQRHAREIDSATRVAAHYGFRHRIVHADGLFPKCPMTSSAELSEDPLESIVPNRNATMLSIAAAEASTHSHRSVFIGVHGGDRVVFPDCRAEFIDAVASATWLSCRVVVHSPFVRNTRAEVIQIGRALEVPFGLTWSCYRGGESPCGECMACRSRSEATK